MPDPVSHSPQSSQSDPTTLSKVHRAAFTASRGWSVDEFAALLASRHIFAVEIAGGFALGRVVVDESELLTIAVTPEQQGQGIGRALLIEFEQTSRGRGATRGFLDVAADNMSALSLYARANWCESGRRVGYYTRSDGAKQDAILMEKHFPLG